jgi:hypothetical protein
MIRPLQDGTIYAVDHWVEPAYGQNRMSTLVRGSHGNRIDFMEGEEA